MMRIVDSLGIKNGASPVPDEVMSLMLLRPNYPNPFNPSTTIAYEVSAPGLVRLQVFDLRGRQVPGP